MFATSPYLFGQRRGEKREEREKTERERAVSNQAWSQQERSKANNTQTTNNHKYLYYFSSTPTQHSSPKKNHLHFEAARFIGSFSRPSYLLEHLCCISLQFSMKGCRPESIGFYVNWNVKCICHCSKCTFLMKKCAKYWEILSYLVSN